MEARKKEFRELVGTFYEIVRSEKAVKEYLASDGRMEYSMVIASKLTDSLLESVKILLDLTEVILVKIDESLLCYGRWHECE
ncbi:hypothetical protein LTR17_019954 [Elasticomyces elasticus]|nr:hypothetical protein LTR17_019954 [Elasticomyces elasticus]